MFINNYLETTIGEQTLLYKMPKLMQINYSHFLIVKKLNGTFFYVIFTIYFKENTSFSVADCFIPVHAVYEEIYFYFDSSACCLRSCNVMKQPYWMCALALNSKPDIFSYFFSDRIINRFFIYFFVPLFVFLRNDWTKISKDVILILDAVC